MNLLIKIPTRERGFEWLRLYLDNLTDSETRVLLSLDLDQPGPPDWVVNDSRVFIKSGYSENKIHAINRDIDDYIDAFDILLVGSDDMWPVQRGFDSTIIEDMRQIFPSTDGCLWYDTEDAERELRRRYHREIKAGSTEFYDKWICMLPVMGKAYYKRFGYVYNNAYKSFYCDNEWTHVAVNKFGRFAKIRYVGKRIIRHEHPSWGGAMPQDRLYAQANRDMDADMRVFHRRKLTGFK